MDEPMVLRVPNAVAARIRELIRDEDREEELIIDFSADGRHSKVTFDGQSFAGTLLDLPCVVEAHKLIGSSVLVKSCDIGQVLVVHAADDPPRHRSFATYRGLAPPSRHRWTRARQMRRTKGALAEMTRKIHDVQMSLPDPSEKAGTPSTTSGTGAIQTKSRVRVVDVNEPKRPNPDVPSSSPRESSDSPTSMSSGGRSNLPASPSPSPAGLRPMYSVPSILSQLPLQSQNNPFQSSNAFPPYPNPTLPQPGFPFSFGLPAAPPSTAAPLQPSPRAPQSASSFLASVESAAATEIIKATEVASPVVPERVLRQRAELEDSLRRLDEDIAQTSRRRPLGASAAVQARFDKDLDDKRVRRSRIAAELDALKLSISSM